MSSQTDNYPAHDRSRFYKYVSAETAKIVLETKQVRYSSPLVFNDPFDVQTGLPARSGLPSRSDVPAGALNVLEPVSLDQEERRDRRQHQAVHHQHRRR